MDATWEYLGGGGLVVTFVGPQLASAQAGVAEEGVAILRLSLLLCWCQHAVLKHRRVPGDH